MALLMRMGLILLMAVMLASVGTVQAEQPSQAGQFSLHFENDVLGLDDSDRHYTNGIQFSWQTPGPHLSGWLDNWIRNGFFDDETTLRGRISVGQNLFTPEDIQTAELIPDDRPYAAWLHADFAVLGCSDRALEGLEFSIGMVGPAAFGKEVQKWFHEIIDSPDPQGWDNQIKNELAVLIAYDRRWRNLVSPRLVPLLGDLGVKLDLSPHVEMAIGNVYTYGGAGATLRLGTGLERDYGPPRIRPAPLGASFDLQNKQTGIYGFVGLTGRAMLQNIFLDGNTFRDSHSVKREVWVGEFHWGLVLTGFGVRLGSTYVVRSREFTLQKQPDHFGALTFSVAF